jgi:hypothetical protein
MRKLLSICLFIAFSVGCSSDNDNSANNQAVYNLITITTAELPEFNLDNAFTGGTLSVALDAANAAQLTYGVCYGLTPQPVITDNIGQPSSGNSDTGAFSTTLALLEPGTTYYARAYVTNGDDVKYGNEITFTIPRIIEDEYAQTTATDFMFGTTVTVVGSVTISSSGCCFGSTANPTIANEVSYAPTDENGYLEVNCASPTLLPGQTYHARSFIVADGRTFYGADLTLRMAGYVGPSGGIVVFDLGRLAGMSNAPFTNWRYIEVSPSTINYNGTSDYFWGCSGYISLDDHNIGYGAWNTVQMGYCNLPNTSSNICKNAVISGNSDWYLPNVAELKVIYKSKLAGVLNMNKDVWASNQDGVNTAVAFSLSNGTQLIFNKNQYGPSPAILPIRYFQ